MSISALIDDLTTDGVNLTRGSLQSRFSWPGNRSLLSMHCDLHTIMERDSQCKRAPVRGKKRCPS